MYMCVRGIYFDSVFYDFSDWILELLGQCGILFGQCGILFGQCGILFGQCGILFGQSQLML
jgi:hypothetical protein